MCFEVPLALTTKRCARMPRKAGVGRLLFRVDADE